MKAREGERWVARPVLAGLIRVLVVLVPALAGALAAWEVSRLWEKPSGFGAVLGWFVTLVAVAVAVVLVVQRSARRFLPLAWLFTLTMAFPDRTPSRMVTARRAASRRSRRRALQQLRREGLGRDPYEASEAALVLVAALGAHDRRTRGHSERVRTLADLLAKEAGVPDDDRDKLRWGALLHDIGKLSVPGAILNKPDRPDEEEWATLKRHPEEGAHLVEPLETWLGPWAGSVGHHHERWDGKGYPLGLAGEDISLGGRILAIADAYEVMTAARAYKVPMSAAAARKELVASAGTHFDPALVRAFMGISIGALWWTSGVAALLAQIPLLGRGRRRPGARPGPVGPRRGGHGGRHGDRPGGGRCRRRRERGRSGRLPPGGRPIGRPRGASRHAGPHHRARPRAGARGARSADHRDHRGAVPRSPPATSLDALLGGIALPVTTATATPPSRRRAVRPDVAAGDAPRRPPPAAPQPFTAQGRLLAPDLLGPLGIGLTNRGPVGGCGPSASQGLDAWVFELPSTAPGAGAPVKATGSDLLGLHNLAVRFLGPDCSLLGQLDTSAADEAGVLPAGTRYVVVSDRLGIGTAITLTVG